MENNSGPKTLSKIPYPKTPNLLKTETENTVLRALSLALFALFFNILHPCPCTRSQKKWVTQCDRLWIPVPRVELSGRMPRCKPRVTVPKNKKGQPRVNRLTAF